LLRGENRIGGENAAGGRRQPPRLGRGKKDVVRRGTKSFHPRRRGQAFARPWRREEGGGVRAPFALDFGQPAVRKGGKSSELALDPGW